MNSQQTTNFPYTSDPIDGLTSKQWKTTINKLIYELAIPCPESFSEDRIKLMYELYHLKAILKEVRRRAKAERKLISSE